MKNFLICCLFITLSIIVNSCEEGFKDESTQFSLVLKEVTAVPSLTTDNTPDYTFSSNIAGTIKYGGSCSSSTTTANQGNNKITLDSLSDGTYSDCTITVDVADSTLINSLTMTTFTIDSTAETLLEVTAVTTPTNATTPNYTFSTNEAGTLTYGGSCSSSTTSAISGNNTITLDSLSDGTYSDCTITFTNSSANSVTLSISSFVIDTTAPTVTQETAVTTPTNDTTPNYTFSTNEAGTITYGGSCSSSTTSAITGNNTVTFNALVDGTYDNCTITVTDNSSNSVTLNMSSFVIDTSVPGISEECLIPIPTRTNDNTPDCIFSSGAGTITYGGACSSSTTSATTDNNTITFSTLSDGTYSDCTITVTDSAGNSSVMVIDTFIVDATAPTVSSISTTADNQSSVSTTDNITVTFSEAMESSYVTTSTSDTNCAGSIRVSSDNYSTCVKMSSEPVSSNSNRTFTLDPYDNLTVGSTYLTRVTTGVKDTAGNAMSSQYETSSGFTTADLTEGVFVAVGDSGNILKSTDNGLSWDNASTPLGSGLYAVTFGNNTFVAVGTEGKIVRSTDNGTTWDNETSPTENQLRDVTF